ncbi:MAG: recombinase family protein, partial [Proteobacteria bacterium]
MKKKVAIYARLSKEELANLSKKAKDKVEFVEDSIEEQIEKMTQMKKEYDESCTCCPEKELVVYMDKGHDGRNVRGPALKKLLRDVAKSKIDTILITKSGRITKSYQDWLYLSVFFHVHDVTLVSLDEISTGAD